MAGEFIQRLKSYYDKSFPYQLIYNWLNYKDGDANCFRFREFSFTLPGDIYVRYQAYERALEFRTALLHRVPLKIDVGAVFNMSPKLSRSYPLDFTPQQHELVFDIDISDYNDVRTCCKESNICSKCWPFMKIGAKVLHRILTQEFGFKHFLFVYSGRRGFHCWVCDKSARFLGSDARKAITDYLSVVTGGQSMVKRVNLNPLHNLHPMLVKALNVIDDDFKDLMVHKQDFLANEHLIQNVLDLCDDKQLQERLSERVKYLRSSEQCWDTINSISNSHKGRRSKHFINEVKLQHCYPRLDVNVTKGLNHLLKLPFCVHPKTENICVPIDIDDIDNFDLDAVPNLKNMQPHSMDPYIRIMKQFIDRLAE